MSISISKTCINCNARFTSQQKSAKYCSARCKDLFYKKVYPERHKERQRRSYKKHREERIKNGKDWRKKNPNYNQIRYRNNPELRLWNYKDRSNKRKIRWELSDEQAINLMTSPCYYCGDTGLGIDRVDSKLGYSLENCVSCCKECNTMKMDTPINVFLDKVRKIYKRLISDIQ